MPEPTLYVCPHACSLVSHIAFEKAGIPVIVDFVDVFVGEQDRPSYRRINPRGKVPFLVAGDERIGENLAILMWLHQRFPAARLLPPYGSAEFVSALSDLGWMSSGIHPILTRTLAPERFADGTACRQSVRVRALSALMAELARLDERLAGREWWLDEPSALDFTAFWLWARAGEGIAQTRHLAHCAAHGRRMIALPYVQAALRRERTHRPCFPHLAF